MMFAQRGIASREISQQNLATTRTYVSVYAQEGSSYGKQGVIHGYIDFLTENYGAFVNACIRARCRDLIHACGSRWKKIKRCRLFALVHTCNYGVYTNKV